MSTQLSVAARNARVAALIATIGTSPVLKFFNGALPANVAASDAGTALSTMALPSSWMGTPSNGSASMVGTWQDAGAAASGYASHARLYASDGATCGFQCFVAQAYTFGTPLGVGQQAVNNGLVYRVTSAGTTATSGAGPTGSGSSITDGSVTFAYAGTSDMVIDNSNIVAGQEVTVNAFTFTDGNA